MNCPGCGRPIKEGAKFCPNCGSAVGQNGEAVAAGKTDPVSAQTAAPNDALFRPDPGKGASAVGNANPPVPPAYAFTPYPAVPMPAPAVQEPLPGQVSGKKKRKKPKKQSSGCLMSFLISLAVFLVLGLILFFVIGWLLPGIKGDSEDKQVQREYEEPMETSELRRELNGTYEPDEKDFRYESDSISGYVDHVILVYFRKGVSDEEVRRVASLVDGELIGCISGLDIFEIRVSASGIDALEEICERLSYEESVDYATVDSVRKASSQWNDPGLDDHVTNDPWGEWTWVPEGIRYAFLQQWSMLWPRGKNWHQEIVGAPSSWAYEEYYSPISVGIIDGGFDTSHPDLRITIVNQQANDATLRDSRYKGSYDHGTHVAGIIGATRGNGTGVNGILCGQYSLYGYCANNDNRDTETASEVLYAGNALLNQGCRVINRSRGNNWRYYDGNGVYHDCISRNNRPINENTGNEYSEEYWEEEGIKAARDVLRLLDYYGPTFLLVNSAGNNSIEARYNGWLCSITRECAEEAVRLAGPECRFSAQDILDAVIVVGSVDNNKNYGKYTFIRSGRVLVPAYCNRRLQLSDFSNFGSQVTICAPGNKVYSTVDHRGCSADYKEMSGTSMASPVIAACAAQVWSVDLSMSPGRVKDFLTANAVSGVLAGSDKDRTGSAYGMVSLKDAVENALLDRGRISETRPDGNLKRIAQIISYGKLEEAEEEITDLVEQYSEYLSEGEYGKAVATVYTLLKSATRYQIYGLIYYLAELL